MKNEADVQAAIVHMVTDDNRRMRAAGCALAEAATRVIREYDGLHRLSLAVAAWHVALANEGGREARHGGGPTPTGSAPPPGAASDGGV